MLISLIILTAVDSQVFLLCAIIFSLILFIFSMFHKDIREDLILPTVAFSVLLSCLLFIFPYSSYNKAVAYTENVCTVRAVVKQMPYFSAENRRYYTTAKIKTINDTKVNSDVKLSFSEKPEITPDNEILFDGFVYKTGSSVKSVENYYKGEKIYIGCYSISNLKITSDTRKGYYHYKEKLTDYINDAFSKRFKSEVSGLLVALVTGDKSLLDGNTYNNFKRSGVAHLMAVSGLHLSVWVMFLQLIADKRNRHRILNNLFIMAVVVLIMITASFSGSVKRAGFMCLLHLFGRMLNEKSDSLNSLGFAVAVILIINPYSVFDIGFLLSFLSTLSIIIMALPLSDRLNSKINKTDLPDKIKPLLKPIIVSVMISISTALFTFPVIAINFGYFSLISPLTNILFLPVTFILILCAGIFVLLSFSYPLSTPFSLVCSVLSDYAIFITSRLSAFRYSAIPVGKNSVLLWAVIAVCIIIFTRFFKRNKSSVKITLTCFLVVVGLISTFNLKNSIGSYKLHLISSEEKICAVVSAGSQCVLTGYCDNYYFEETVLDIIAQNNLKLKAVVGDESKKLKDFAQKYGADYIITEQSDSITLINTVTIALNENKITIDGNNNHFEIVGCDYLQQTDKYDIITYSSKNSTESNADSVNIKQIDNLQNSYIAVRSDGTFTFGGDTIG